MRVLITGANGFVGQHLAPMALKYFKRSEILCLVCDTGLALEKRGLSRLKKAGLNTLYVDLVTGKNIDKIPKSPEVLIHLAANTDTAKSNHEVNDLGTKNLLDALGPLGPKNQIIYTSTTVLMSGRLDCSKPFDEDDSPWPTNRYGRTKLKAEEILKKACQKDKFKLTITRLNTVYGDDSREFKLFKSLKNYILKGSIIGRLNWPGLTSIIHVDDVSEAILCLIRKPGQPGKPRLLLLGAEALSMARISQLMHKGLGREYRSVKLPDFFWGFSSFNRRFVPILDLFLPEKYYNLFWRLCLIVDDVIYCKSNKISKILPGWKPRKLENALADVVNL